MGSLVTRPNLQGHDSLYRRLLDLHAGRSETESAPLNARLLLLLMNHIGDEAVIVEAFKAATAIHGN